jgi:hypothetical protein
MNLFRNLRKQKYFSYIYIIKLKSCAQQHKCELNITPSSMESMSFLRSMLSRETLFSIAITTNFELEDIPKKIDNIRRLLPNLKEELSAMEADLANKRALSNECVGYKIAAKKGGDDEEVLDNIIRKTQTIKIIESMLLTYLNGLESIAAQDRLYEQREAEWRTAEQRAAEQRRVSERRQRASERRLLLRAAEQRASEQRASEQHVSN